MKTLLYSVLAGALAAPAACNAAIVPLLITNSATPHESIVFRSSVAGHPGEAVTALRSRVPSYTAEFDTVSDAVAITAPTFVTEGINKSWTRQISVNFPDPLKTLTESISFDAVAPHHQLLTSTNNALSNLGGGRWHSFNSVTVQFPESFVLTGSYTVQGPTQDATVPFSVTFQRTGAAVHPGIVTFDVRPGDNFPATAVVSPGTFFLRGSIYQPTSPVVFNNVVDGLHVIAEFVPIELWTANVPEPSTSTLALLGAATAITRVRRQRIC